MKQAIFAALLLGGCAYTTSTTDIAPMGLDTYSVGATAGHYVGGSAEARSLALQKANGYCQRQSLQTKVVAIEPAGERANVTFMCLAANDPRLQAPMAGQTFNVNVNQGR
jgi:hypothetical protein